MGAQEGQGALPGLGRRMGVVGFDGLEKNRGHRPKPPDWRDWLRRPLIEQYAHHWAFINAVGFAEVSELATVVRFEDVVLKPKESARRICDMLGPQDRDRALGEWARRVQNTNNIDFVEAKTSRS